MLGLTTQNDRSNRMLSIAPVAKSFKYYFVLKYMIIIRLICMFLQIRGAKYWSLSHIRSVRRDEKALQQN